MCLYRRRIVRCANCEDKIIDEQRVLIERCDEAWTSGTARIHPICLNWRYDDDAEDEDVVSDDMVCTPCFDKLREEAAKERERRGEPPLEEGEEEEEEQGSGSGSSGKQYDSDGYSI
ncbi:hypothetical protein CF327_g498 [Tilletia walkeri]|uniref:Uncharacterized protein n=1 Tax=Tilletia walkeri TaxID=117179 RepID=A0A8X7NG28_9BASI|nr:hypothetical protein CF327_g498 [Tilletia walkeri]KAE8271730.1 hypothetical protein A4X09_0g574 [Tilletia walkeri]